jgi:hypothetical protein
MSDPIRMNGVEEFSIMELEDRLELAERCNNNCSCPGPTKPPTDTVGD